jgi:transcriptional regulator with XRE-family HTH domain
VPRREPADDVTRAFGLAVRRRREERGETIETIARRVGGGGMSPAYYAELERGWHSPSLRTLARIADAYAISLSELLEDV